MTVAMPSEKTLGHRESATTPRKSCCLVVLVGTLFAATAFADGISVTEDLKHPKGKYYTIKLNSKQITDVERRRRVTLTKKQVKQFEKDYAGKGESYPVLSTRYDSCTCFVLRYVWWGTPGEVDIDERQVKAFAETQTTGKEELAPEGDDTSSDPMFPWIHLIMDSKGSMFSEGAGKRLTEEDVVKILRSYGKARGEKNCKVGGLTFDTPPPIDPEFDKTMWAKLRRIMAVGKTICIPVQIQGYERATRRKEFAPEPGSCENEPAKCRRTCGLPCEPAKAGTELPAELATMKSGFARVRSDATSSDWDAAKNDAAAVVAAWERLKPKVSTRVAECPAFPGGAMITDTIDAVLKSLMTSTGANFKDGAVDAATQGIDHLAVIKGLFE
ncbi:MAG: hypothetical protein HY897_01675 [Deltaproteobacteria bacterium]|nr:hypothetical protein [Deltaproteobacteria bacterium]